MYHKEFPGASMASIDKQNPRFLQAYYAYTKHKSDIEEVLEKRRQTK